MGQKKKSSSEHKILKLRKTDTGCGINATTTDPPPPEGGKPAPTAPKIDTLKAILNGINSPHNTWSREALKEILKKYGRVPRNGWPVIYNKYYEKFRKPVDFKEFQESATSTVKNFDGRKCCRKIFNENSTKQQKSIIDYLKKILYSNC